LPASFNAIPNWPKIAWQVYLMLSGLAAYLLTILERTVL
jgi:hypothetical protein